MLNYQRYRELLINSVLLAKDLKDLPQKLGTNNVVFVSDCDIPYFECCKSIENTEHPFIFQFKIYYTFKKFNSKTICIIPVIVPVKPTAKELQTTFPNIGLTKITDHCINVDYISFPGNMERPYETTYEVIEPLFNLMERKQSHSLWENFEDAYTPVNNTGNSSANIDKTPDSSTEKEAKFSNAIYYGITRIPSPRTSPDCSCIFLSDRAWRAIISETSEYGFNETGGLLLGNFDCGFWYIIDSIDGGFETTNSPTLFKYQKNYVNHVFKKIARLYKYPLTIEGIWHRHPGSMDYFSDNDYIAMSELVDESNYGMIFMLVNVDPELRLTFYYLDKKKQLFSVPYFVGDNCIVKEFLELADPKTLSYNGNQSVRIADVAVLKENDSPTSLDELRNFFNNINQ